MFKAGRENSSDVSLQEMKYLLTIIKLLFVIFASLSVLGCSFSKVILMLSLLPNKVKPLSDPSSAEGLNLDPTLAISAAPAPPPAVRVMVFSRDAILFKLCRERSAGHGGLSVPVMKRRRFSHKSNKPGSSCTEQTLRANTHVHTQR